MRPTITGGHEPADSRTHIERLNDPEPAPPEPAAPAAPAEPEAKPEPVAKEEAPAAPARRRKKKR